MSNYTGKVIDEDYVPPPTSGISEPTKFAASLGRSASLGLSDYLAALGIKGTRAVTGGAPVTFQEALADVRGLTQQMKKESPLTYGAGQVAGALAGPGAAVGRTVSKGVDKYILSRGPEAKKYNPLKDPIGPSPYIGTIAGMAGTGAVTGGISGFTEDENVKQAALSAGLGALTGGAVGTAFQGVKVGIDKAVRLDAARQLEKIISGKQRDARQTLESIIGKDIITEDFKGRTFEAAKEYIKTLKKGALSASETQGVVNVVSNLANLTRGERAMNVGAAAIRGAGGATAGGGLELLSGGFIPPGLAAAGLGLYGAKEQLGRLGIEEARRLGVKLATQETLPLAYSRFGGVSPTPSAIGAGTAATAGALMPARVPVSPAEYTGRVLPEEELTPAAPVPAGDMFTPLMPPEATAPMPRLRQLAEEFRQRTGGQ